MKKQKLIRENVSSHQFMTLILHAPIIYISVERGFDNVAVELGIVGLILWVEMGLSSSISPCDVAKKAKATPWFPLASVTILSPFMLFLQVTSIYLRLFAFNEYPPNSWDAHQSIVAGLLVAGLVESPSVYSYARRDFAIRAYVGPWTDILYRLQMFPTAIEPALAETASRQG